MLYKFIRAFKQFQSATIQIIDNDRIETKVYRVAKGLYVLINEHRNKMFIYQCDDDFLTEVKFYDNDIRKGVKSIKSVYDYDIILY